MKLSVALLCTVALVTGCDDGGKRESSRPPGLAIRIRAVPQSGHRLTRADVDRAVTILRHRIDTLGVRDPAIEMQGRRTLLILLPGYYDRKGAALLTKTGLLEFYDFEAALRGTGRPVAVSCDAARGTCPKKRYVFKRRPELTGADVDPASVRFDFDPATNAPIVVMQFKPRARGIFHAITRREAHRGARLCSHVPQCAQHFAIVLDRKIQSLPYIDFVHHPNGISAANGVQLEMPSVAEAKELAIVLQEGALPVRFVRLP